MHERKKLPFRTLFAWQEVALFLPTFECCLFKSREQKELGEKRKTLQYCRCRETSTVLTSAKKLINEISFYVDKMLDSFVTVVVLYLENTVTFFKYKKKIEKN